MELTDAEKHASYINLIETIAALSRGDVMDDDWIDAQIDRVRYIRRYYSDMSLVNIEREDSEFRNIALGLEMNLKVMMSEIDLFGTLDTDTYLEFSQGILRLINMIEEDEDLSNAFAKLLR
jgi:hypothetical protein